MNIYLAEIEAHNGTSVVTLRYTSGAGYDNSGTFYEPRLIQPARLQRDARSALLGGRASQSYGELLLTNLDGGIDALADYFFDGRTLTLKYGDESAAYGTFATVLVATIESVGFESEQVSVRLRDRASVLDVPFSSVKYAGSNSLPNGIEGTSDDIKGQYKPRIFGRIALMSPVMVNTSKLIYQVNAAEIDTIVNIYDAGAYLTRSTDYSSQADMEANQPTSGTFRIWPAGGCFRLGATPYGAVSCVVAEKWDHTQISAAGIILRILTELGWTSADYVAADFTTLNQKCCAPLGVVIDQGETISAIFDRICATVGAWWGFDALNRFRVGRLDTPSSPALTLTDTIITNLERQPPDEQAVWSVTVQADRNYAVQDRKSLAGIVSDARAAWLSAETRDQKAENAAIKTTRLLAEDRSYPSLFCSISQAQAEATRRLNLLSVRRDTVTLTVLGAGDNLASIDIGSAVTLQSAQLGYSAGRTMIITGIALDFETDTADLTLWG